MGSDIFFHSLEEGETCEVKLGEGKILIVRLQEVRPVDNEGMREAIFEVNGNRRIIKIKDKTVTVNSSNSVLYANEDNPMEIGANIPGNIIKILVKEGDKVVTSYISTKYLPGILIGYVTQIQSDSNNLTSSGTITPAVDFAHLEEVLVITDQKASYTEAGEN